MKSVVTREMVLERVRKLPEDLLGEADLRLAELNPVSDEEWLRILAEAPLDDEPLSLKELVSLDAEHERREERRKQGQRKRTAI